MIGATTHIKFDVRKNNSLFQVRQMPSIKHRSVFDKLEHRLGVRYIGILVLEIVDLLRLLTIIII